VKFNKVRALMVVVGIFSSSLALANGLDETATAKAAAAADITTLTVVTKTYQPHLKRPSVLPALYVTLGAMQAWDLASTSSAIKAGAHEANPAAAAFATSQKSMMGLKAVTTAGTILFAERAWKRNKAAAVVMMVAVNGAMAAVAMNNMRNAQMARAR
jgi:hypothetical protein